MVDSRTSSSTGMPPDTSPMSRTPRTPLQRITIVMKHMLVVSGISNFGAVICALVYGVLNPFSAMYTGDAKTRAIGIAGSAALTSFYLVWWGVLTASVLYAFFLRGRYLRSQIGPGSDCPLTLTQSWVIAVRLSWKRAVLLSLMAVAITLALVAVGVPVVHYNFHSLAGVICMAIHSVQAISRVARFRQKNTSSVSVFASNQATASTAVLRVRTKRSLSQALCVAVTNVFPQLFAAAAGMQFMAVGRGLDSRNQWAVVAFIACGLVFKFSFQVTAKMLAMRANTASSNWRNRLYVITSPILIIEIYLRMAALRLGSSGSSTRNLYAGTVAVGLIEVFIRFFAVVLDHWLVSRKRAKVKHKKRELLRRKSGLANMSSSRSIQIAPTVKVLSGSLRQRQAALLEAEFEQWEANHSRLTAVEVMAEMMAEYCAIGFACVYVVLLRYNPGFDLGTSSAVETRGESTRQWLAFLGTQLTTYAVQMVVEFFSDIVGGTIEIRMGILVDEIIAKDDVEYIRWTMLVLAIHAGGLSISGFVSAGDG